MQPYPVPIQPITGNKPSQTLDNRFGADEDTGVVTSGGTHTVTSQNGNFHSVSSVLKPDGQVITTQQSGKFP